MSSVLPAAGVRRVAFVAQSLRALARYRGNLMREIARGRHQVLAVAPTGDAGSQALLREQGIAFTEFRLEPQGAGPFAARRSERALTEALREFAPHVVVSSGERTAILGTDVAKSIGTPRCVLIVNGLKSLALEEFHRQGWLGARSIRRSAKAALAQADIVVFHNSEDPRRLEHEGLLAREKPRLITPGSGIDLEHFAQVDLPSPADGLVFAMLGRLDKATGALAFADAAARIKAKAPATRFVLAGPPGEGPDAVSVRHPLFSASMIELPGFVEDVRPIIADSHVVVHPSMSEGLPGALLESLAMGRPVIASDIPGSRQVVDERVNGVLVPPGDVAALAAAMDSYLRRPDLIPAMARASRAKAERLFDVRDVTRTMMAALALDT